MNFADAIAAAQSAIQQQGSVQPLAAPPPGELTQLAMQQLQNALHPQGTAAFSQPLSRREFGQRQVLRGYNPRAHQLPNRTIPTGAGEAESRGGTDAALSTLAAPVRPLEEDARPLSEENAYDRARLAALNDRVPRGDTQVRLAMVPERGLTTVPYREPSYQSNVRCINGREVQWEQLLLMRQHARDYLDPREAPHWGEPEETRLLHTDRQGVSQQCRDLAAHPTHERIREFVAQVRELAAADRAQLQFDPQYAGEVDEAGWRHTVHRLMSGRSRNLDRGFRAFVGAAQEWGLRYAGELPTFGGEHYAELWELWHARMHGHTLRTRAAGAWSVLS